MKTRWMNVVMVGLHTVLGMPTVFAQDVKWKNSIFGNLEAKQYDFHVGADNGFSGVNKSADFGFSGRALEQTITGRSLLQPFSYTLRLTSIVSGAYAVPLFDEPVFVSEGNRLNEKHRYFSVEYNNDAKGLKQNFVIPQKIGLNPSLEVSLEFSSPDCYPRLSKGEISIVSAVNQHKEIARYGALKVYDARGKVLPASFQLNQKEIIILIDQRDAVYPLTIDPLSTTASVQVAGNQAGMQLGYCVSGAGDVNADGYSDVIVGAWRYDNGQTNEGAAFVYLGSANGLSSTPAWSAEGNQNQAEFGINVSEAGDVNGDGYADVIVGADRFDNGQTDEGKIYVYYGNASGLSATPAWTYESNQASASLGFIVSTAGDVNGDGYSDIIAGAPLYDNGQTNEGVVLLFYGSSSGLPGSPNLTLEQNQANAQFGWSVSSAGDVNSDGFADIIASASYYDNGQTDEGKAWVYLGNSSGLGSTAAWSGESNQALAYYGENVSWAGDLNGDGYGDIAVGADYNDNGQTDEGRVYIYHGTSSGPSSTATIVLERNQAMAYFGVGVNGAGDVNGDGYGDLVVGAYHYDNGETDEGAAFVYYGSSAGLSQTLFTILESNQANAALGISVCSAGDVNGDGFSDVIAGAYVLDNTLGTADVGGFYIYNGQPENLGTAVVPNMPFTLSQASAGLGNAVTCIGDVNSDGFSDIAVAASLFDNGQTDRGVVYIFHGSPNGYTSTPNTVINGPAFNNAQFGASVGAAGDVNGDGYSDIVVGAPGYTNGQSNEGAFFVYLGSGSGINPSAHLSVESNLASAALGFSVSGAGDVNGDGYSDIVVGANGYTSGQTNEGRAYVYYGSSSGVNSTSDWQYETNVAAERFGACVAGIGDANGDGYSDLVVLSSGYTNGETNEGRLFYFTGGTIGLSTAPVNTFETNVANAGINPQSCSYVGDINGDGFNELVIGISTFNSGGTTNEGLLRVYYGATPDLTTSTIQNIEGNSTSFLLGAVVGFGGDVNGDGYNDVVTGSPTYNNASTPNEGIVRVYLGSSVGLATTPVYTFEGNTTGYSVGSSVCSAGDINSDGYSDLLVGAKDYDAGTAPLNVGRIYAFYGNNAHGVVPKSMVSRQYKNDMSTVVQSSNGTFESSCNFGIGHFQKAHLGRERAKLLYEVKGHPHPFWNYGSAMNTCVDMCGIQGTYTNLGLTGTYLTMGASSIPPMGFPKWRTRVKYHPVDAIDGQMYGRWFYGGIHDKQDRSIKVSMVTCGVLPVEVSSYEVTCDENIVQLRWNMGDESNVAAYDIYTSANGEDFNLAQRIAQPEAGQYNVNLENTGEIQLVRVVALDNNNNGHELYTVALNCVRGSTPELTVYPNPSPTFINLSLPVKDGDAGEIASTVIMDMNGQQVYQSSGYSPVIDVSSLANGFYQVSLFTVNGRKFTARFVRM